MCSYHIERSEQKEASRLLDLAASICDSAEGTADLAEYQLRIYRGRIGVAFVTRNKDEYFQYAEMSLKAETERYEKSGEASSNLAAANHHMGIAYNMNSLYREAIPFLEESARVRRSLPGFKKDWLFTPKYQLAHAYFHLGDDAKSVELLESAIKDRIEVLGKNDHFSMRSVCRIS
jgi:tetratricopeptide (TPR) repeat protein